MTAKTIVAFFGGTRIDVNPQSRGYVSPQAIGAKHNLKRKPEDIDEAFQDLSALLTQEQTQYSYDGCHHDGGGVFAYGVKKPGRHLFQKIQEAIAQGSDPINLVISAHSRGCLSALYVAKKISRHPDLASKVNIILDLRDPVPGNSRIVGYSSNAVASQLADFQECGVIKKVHISIHDQLKHPAFFNVLIPRFSPKTIVELDPIPGKHGVLQSRKYQHIYVLGLLKTLQIYLENGVDVDFEKFFTLPPIQQFIRKKMEGTPEAIIPILKKSQIEIYQYLLNEIKRETEERPQRGLHFGGWIGPLVNKNEASCVNARHAALLEESGKLVHQDVYLGYHGPQRSGVDRDLIHKYYLRVVNETQFYLSRLKRNPKKYCQQIAMAEAIMKSLFPKPHAAQAMMEKLEIVHYILNTNQAILIRPDDRVYRDRVLHLIGSICTLGLYAGIRALHSQITRHSPKFWKSKSEIYVELTETTYRKMQSIKPK